MIERDDEGGSAKLKVMGKEQDKEEEEEKKVLKGEQLCISWIGCCQRLLRPFYFVAFCSPGRLVLLCSFNKHTHTHTHRIIVETHTGTQVIAHRQTDAALPLRDALL